MTFPLAFPAGRRGEITEPGAQPRLLLRGVEFAAALAVNLGPDPATTPVHVDRGVIVAGPRVPAAVTRSWITSW
ncbi:hypothetical protein [Actinoplanes sichuanensis]|nr:hypothetical protein [Actinoplanes sichuanensis]